MDTSSRRPWIRVIHGPNLNLLGTREPEIYGARSLAALDHELSVRAQRLGVELDLRQSNHEGQIIDWVQGCRDLARDESGGRPVGLIINPAGFTHTSVAIQDALRAAAVPAIEVHLSNLYGREALRHTSVTGVACAGVIMGLGFSSYFLALEHLAAVLLSR